MAGAAETIERMEKSARAEEKPKGRLVLRQELPDGQDANAFKLPKIEQI